MDPYRREFGKPIPEVPQLCLGVQEREAIEGQIALAL